MGDDDEASDDLPRAMRAGIRARIFHMARSAGSSAYRWTPSALVALVAAGAFAPLLVVGVSAEALAAAAGAVGGNVLTDLVVGLIARMRPAAGASPDAGLAQDIEERLARILEDGGAEADRLREDLAAVFAEIGAVGAAIQAAIEAGDRDLQLGLTRGFDAMSARFAEFAFVVADVAAELRSIRTGVDEQGGHLLRMMADLELSVGLQYRQAADSRLLLEQVAALRRATGDGRDERRWTAGSPYRGLLPFGPADAEIFYGRQYVTAQLVAALAQRRDGPGLVIVTGASGVGKSSLLRAGLLPAVARGELSPSAREWPRELIEQPAADPMSRLATRLAGLAGLPAPGVLATLRDRPAEAHLLVRQAVETDIRRRGLGADPEARLLLIVDQFEEVFRHEVADRAAFIAALHAAATAGVPEVPPALVVLAVRGDFVGHCADDPHLADALRHPFVVGPMAESDLRLAITGPADAAHLELEPGLADAILAELRLPYGGYAAGALPLLSQALLTTWEHRAGDRLTSSGYARTGGVTRAVATSAEEAYLALDEAGRDAARQVFHRLTAVSPDGMPARRPVARHTLTADGAADAVVAAFADRRLLVVDDDVQISHDVLLTAWPRLAGWMEADLAGYALFSQLRDDAEEWARHGRAAGYLYRRERLAAVLEAVPRWEADPGGHPGLPREFLDASARGEQRAGRLRRTVIATLSVLLAIALIAAGVTTKLAADAADERLRSLSRQLAAQSESVGDADIQLSRRLSTAAWRLAPTEEARLSMLRAFVRPERATLTGHHAPVRAIAFSPDGSRLATTADDGTALLWDAATGRLVATLRGHSRTVWAAAFSPDGSRLATVGFDGDTRLWDGRTGRAVATLEGHNGLVVAFNRDGSLLATANTDQMARLWDTATGRLVAILKGHTRLVYMVAFSPDGRRLATAGFDNTARLWDVPSGKALRTFSGHTLPVWSVAFSPDGERLATGSLDHAVRLWDVASGAFLRVFKGGHSDVVSSIEFNRDGSRLLTGSDDGSARLWDVASGKALSDGLQPAAFSPDGSHLALAGAVREPRIVDTSTGKDVAVGTLPGHTSLSTIAFSPDGSHLATGGSEGNVRLWDLSPGPAVTTMTSHGGAITALAFSRDGSRLAGGGADGAVHLWDGAHGRAVTFMRPGLSKIHGQARAVAFSPDGSRMAAGSVDSSGLWDAVSGTSLATFEAARSVAFTGDGGRLLTLSDRGAARLWDGRTGRAVATLTTYGIVAGTFVAGGATAATVDETGVVWLWDSTSGRPVTPLNGYTERTTAAAFSPDGSRLAAASDKTVWLRDGTSGYPIADLNGHTGQVTLLAFNRDGSRLATADSAGAVRLWDGKTGRAIGILTGHTAVQALAFSPDGSRLATGGSEGAIRLWDGKSGAAAATLTIHAAVQVLAFSPDGSRLATGGADGGVWLWDVRAGAAITTLTGQTGPITAMAYDSRGARLATGGSGVDVAVRLWDVAIPADPFAALCALAGPLSRQEWTRYLPEEPYQATTCPARA
ncbi:PD40 domain-containing protein [Streptosporangiaceae bacterium NEAU-GS5]|nr:PD40 domain-containing protein [Streptosporangiaceae bacterium NEAU-GS5]